MSEKRTDGRGWVCDSCLELNPHASILTVGDICIWDPCDACGKMQPRRPGNYQGRHLVDRQSFTAIVRCLPVGAADKQRIVDAPDTGIVELKNGIPADVNIKPLVIAFLSIPLFGGRQRCRIL